jgi:Fe-S cluster assembly protein SufD
MSAVLDIFDPKTYPTRRDEDWHYSDFSRHLRAVPDAAQTRNDTLTVAAFETVVQVVKCVDAGIIHETLSIQLAEGSSLTRIVMLNEPHDTTSVRLCQVMTAPGCHFTQFVFSTGAGFQRFETQINHAGEGARVELHGAYLLKDKAHFDLTTRVLHNGDNGVTDQQIRGIIKDQATGIFQGRILVNRGADGTDAKMHHGAILLNDGAKVRAKPELEIYADDVSCAHGNTVGALDEAALFFCQARGMDVVTARSMLTKAYVRPVIDLIEDETAKAEAEAWLEQVSGGFYGL